MKKLKIAYTDKALEIFGAIAGREQADLARTDFTDVAAVVITVRMIASSAYILLEIFNFFQY